MQALTDKPRAQRIEAEHLFPAAQFGHFRPCWRNPGAFPACAKSDGRTLSGRACCQAVDPLFEAAHNDLFNLVPAVGEVNGQRKDYNGGMIPGEKRAFGACNIEVDSSTRRAEPPEAVQGDIARTMFYMADTYGFNLSRQDRQLYTAWSRQDPPDAWEVERNRRIKAIQGKGNRFVEDYAALVRPGCAGGGGSRASGSRASHTRAGRSNPVRLDLRRQDHLRADGQLRGSQVPPDPVRGEALGRRRGAVRPLVPLGRFDPSHRRPDESRFTAASGAAHHTRVVRPAPDTKRRTSPRRCSDRA